MPFVTRAPLATQEKVPRPSKVSIPFSVENKDYSLHVLEHPPTLVSVTFKQKLKTKHGRWSKKPAGIYHFKIHVPWCYFLMRQNRAGAVTDTFLFFAQEKLKNEKGRVYMPPLPNIYPSGHICNGTIKVDFDDPPHVKIAEAFKAFWSTPFTEETWPEDRELIPMCFRRQEMDAYIIEYGYLKYVFQYWESHDVVCVATGHGCAPGDWIWMPFRPRNAHGNYGGYLETLDKVMKYALAFNVKDHIPI